MTPRAVRPDLASRCAAVLLDACLALRVTRIVDADRISVTTFTVAGQTRRWNSAADYHVPHGRLGAGKDGGFRKAGGLSRSSASSGAVAAASRAVSGGRFHFSWTSLSTDVWSKISGLT